MQRLIILFSFILSALSASSQTVNLWYGVNYGKETSNQSNSWHFANFGIDCTTPINKDFNWAAGIGYNTKGGTVRTGYIQAEGNVSYNVAKSGKFNFRVLTGPFVAVKVNQGEYDMASEVTHYLPDAPSYSYNTFLFGWQGGIAMHYSRLSLKLGYERSLTNVCGSSKTSEWFARLGIDL